MIITVRSYLQTLDLAEEQRAAEATLGRSSEAEISYSTVGMYGVLACALLFVLTGVFLCVWGARNQTLIVILGILVQVIGIFLMMSAVKEKANLDLITKHFDSLSDQTKDELLRTLVAANSGSSRDVLGLIELMLNLVFRKDTP